ncbi:MAG: sugar phosphate isomerase/epimerase [Planctomycetaceae bacterium]|nr:sugar phosphate isomerase/epimerase [Planctomycetaceae bacterium]
MSSRFDRRRFLRTTAVAAGGLVASSFAARVLRAADFAGFNVGLQIYSLRAFKLEDALMHCHDLDVSHIEFYPGMFSPDSTPEQIAELKEKLEGYGQVITAHGVNKLTKDHEKNKKLFQFAKAAGIRTITADPDPDSFESLDSLTKEFDVRVAIHNHGPRHRYNKVVDVLRAIEGHDERIGACADLGHFIRSGEKPEDVIRALKGRLYGIHLKDFKEMTDKTEGVILGKGHMDVDQTFVALREINFPADGALSLEYEENKDNPIADIKECLAVARASAKKISA